MIVEYQERNAKVKFNNFNTLKSGVEKKLGVSLSNHRLEYYCLRYEKWIRIFDDADLENISGDTKGRIIPINKGKKIYKHVVTKHKKYCMY